jgi:type VI secretion system protein VasG
LTWNDEFAQVITERCKEVDSGARNVDHILTHSVLPELAREVLERISVAEPFGGVHLAFTAAGGIALRFAPREDA